MSRNTLSNDLLQAPVAVSSYQTLNHVSCHRALSLEQRSRRFRTGCAADSPLQGTVHGGICAAPQTRTDGQLRCVYLLASEQVMGEICNHSLGLY